MTLTTQPPRTEPAAPRTPPPTGAVRSLVDALASMKLTVVVLLLFFVLTLLGTLAQRDHGLFEVQRDFFESLFVPRDMLATAPFYGWLPARLRILPGGYLLMVVLFLNLMVGGIARLRWNVRNTGILVTHLGIGLLLIAAFVKMHWSKSGRVTLWEGEEAASMISFTDYELVLMRQDGNDVVERTVTEDELRGARTGTVTIDDAALPFAIEVSHWFDNCSPRQKGPMFEVDVPVVRDDSGTGVYLQKEDINKERSANTAGCYVTATERKTGAAHQGLTVGINYRVTNVPQRPFTFVVDGVTWGLDLRRQTSSLPFRVRLDRFQKSDHPGTTMARDFSSWVTVFEGDRELPVHIYMNHPLRRDGHVFFQTNWGPQDGDVIKGPPWYSSFEVAVNPSDDWPKYASYVILLGLLGHFLPKLMRHLRSSGRKATLPELS